MSVSLILCALLMTNTCWIFIECNAKKMNDVYNVYPYQTDLFYISIYLHRLKEE